MPDVTDPRWLRDEQYAEPANLRARSALHARYSVDGFDFWEWFRALLAPAPGAVVLDVGCGDGALWRGWSGLTCRPLVTDLSAGMLAAARSALPVQGSAFVSGAMDLPLVSECVDAVVAAYMLYHVADPDAAIAELRRVLRPGGRCYVVTLMPDHMSELDELLASADARLAAGRKRFTTGFDGATAEERLRRVFVQVEVLPLEPRLFVTDADAIIGYLASGDHD